LSGAGHPDDNRAVTHSLHRAGSVESLRDDFVLIAMHAAQPRKAASGGRLAGLRRAVSSPWRAVSAHLDADPRLYAATKRARRLVNDAWRLGLGAPLGPRLAPVAWGPTRRIAAPLLHWLLPTTLAVADRRELRALIAYLQRARLGLSVVVSGLTEEVEAVAAELGLRPHSVELSLGVLGGDGRLPPAELLDLTTMCGHHMISPELVSQQLREIERGRRTSRQAAELMAGQCVCDAFNVERAEQLLAALAAGAHGRELASALRRARQHADTEPMVPATGEPGGVTIDPERCSGCRDCHVYCPVVAIHARGEVSAIDKGRCVECYACYRSRVCEEDAFKIEPLAWPRLLRHLFSSPHGEHATEVSGRGTEEVKTNDVTGRVGPGEVGFTVDVGRPGLGTSFGEIEAVARAMAAAGVIFEPANPLTQLMVDRSRGQLPAELHDERVLSAIVEGKVHEALLEPVVRALQRLAGELGTTLSVGCIGRAAADGSLPLAQRLEQAGIAYRPNAKVNLGMGVAR